MVLLEKKDVDQINWIKLIDMRFEMGYSLRIFSHS